MEAAAAVKSKKERKDKKLKKSGVRTKFLIESLRGEYYTLREENDRLRQLVERHLPGDVSKAILAECFDPNAPKATTTNIDDLAGKMAGASVDDDDDEEEDDE